MYSAGFCSRYPYEALSELTRVAEVSTDESAVVILGGLRNLHEILETVYQGEICVRHEFMEREVVVEALRALRVERGDLYGVATTADFHAVERVLGIKYRRVLTHYSERCQPPTHHGRTKFFEIGELANKFIIWSRKKGKLFAECTIREICDAVFCGNYDVYRLRYHDRLQREVARQLEPGESWNGKSDPAALSKLLRYIDRTERVCFVSIFHLTLEIVARALIRAFLRGVLTIVFADKKAAWTRVAAPVFSMLIRAGLSIYEPRDTAMVHIKQVLADTTVISGSHNLTMAAYGNPDTGVWARNREHSSSSNNYLDWKKEYDLFQADIASGNLVQDEKPSENAVVTSFDTQDDVDDECKISVDAFFSQHNVGDEVSQDAVSSQDDVRDEVLISLDAFFSAESADISLEDLLSSFSQENPNSADAGSDVNDASTFESSSSQQNAARTAQYSKGQRDQVVTWHFANGRSFSRTLTHFRRQPEFARLSYPTVHHWVDERLDNRSSDTAGVPNPHKYTAALKK